MSDAARSLDKESRALIYDGLNINQLAALFGKEAKVISRVVGACVASGARNGHKIYKVRDIANQLLTPSADQLDEAMRRMTADRLPKLLSKEYWAGQRSRQDYELKAGLLWPTDQVVSKVGEVYKIVKMSAQLMSDEIERQTELSDRQRDIIKARCDSMLLDIAMQIQDNFKPIVDAKAPAKPAAKKTIKKPVVKKPATDWEDDDDL